MTEAFVIEALRGAPLDGIHAPNLPGLATSLAHVLAARSGAPLERIETVYCGSDSGLESANQAPAGELPCVRVTRGRDAGYAALQAAAQAILAGDAHLIVAASFDRFAAMPEPEGIWQQLAPPVSLENFTPVHPGADGLFAGGALLASAQAVGRYNLSPRAALIGRHSWAAATAGAAGWLGLLKRAGVEPGEISIVIATPDTPPEWIVSVEMDAAKVNPFGLPTAGERHAAVLLAGLAGVLERDGGRYGLLVHSSPPGDGLAILVERV